MLKKIAWIAGILVLVVAGYIGYILLTTKNHSPAAVAEYQSDAISIEVAYCQPYKKGRTIFGPAADEALVPYGMKWRTGANEATEINFSANVVIEGKVLKAGRYSVYTIPDESSWTVVFNSNLGYWGAKLGGDPFDETKDVLRANASVIPNETEIEQFTISFTPADSLINMNFYWDKTRAILPLQAAQ